MNSALTDIKGTINNEKKSDIYRNSCTSDCKCRAFLCDTDSVNGTNKKTAVLVGDIAAAISIDLGEDGSEEEQETVPMSDVVTYDIADLTIPLESTDGDTANHVAVITVTFSMNSKDKDYKAYGDLSTRESLIKGEINDVVSSYTLEDIKVSGSEVEQQILERVQKMFDSKFIFNVTLSSALYQ